MVTTWGKMMSALSTGRNCWCVSWSARCRASSKHRVLDTSACMYTWSRSCFNTVLLIIVCTCCARFFWVSKKAPLSHIRPPFLVCSYFGDTRYFYRAQISIVVRNLLGSRTLASLIRQMLKWVLVAWGNIFCYNFFLRGIAFTFTKFKILLSNKVSGFSTILIVHWKCAFWVPLSLHQGLSSHVGESLNSRHYD